MEAAEKKGSATSGFVKKLLAASDNALAELEAKFQLPEWTANAGNPYHDGTGRFTFAADGVGGGGGAYLGAYKSLAEEEAQISKGNAAMDRILKEPHLDELDAMHRPGIGSIDFRWVGIRHIVERREREGKLTISMAGQKGDDVARMMPEVIARGRMSPPRNDQGHVKRSIDYGDYQAIIQLDFDGDRRAWLLTGFKKREI
jgi:hypothetical protein